MTVDLLRPQPIHNPSAQPVDAQVSALQAASQLAAGDRLRVTDSYRTGAEILAQLQTFYPAPPPYAPFEERQSAQQQFRQAAMRLLAPISNHRVTLRDARAIGFLKVLYPEQSDFYLPFVSIQELNGAWQRYEQGTHLAVLGRRLHPFYGTYAPTRTSHLELFATWLSQYSGAKSRAVDVGTGCGVLAFLLCKAGFEHVLATDSNPNAIESVRRELTRHTLTLPLELRHADLFGTDPTPADVIVFNPPWVRGSTDTLLDRALQFSDASLFQRFFDAAHARLNTNGRVVMIFSNIIRLTQPDEPHPIEVELDAKRFRCVQTLRRKVKPKPGADGKRRRTREKVEVWELAKA